MGLGLFPQAYNATVLGTFRSNDAQPSPQGAFPKAREKRPGDEVERRRGQRERQINNRFYKQNDNLARAPRFFYIF